MNGSPFHADKDVAITGGTPVELYDPGTAALKVTGITVSPKAVKMRVVVGTADQVGARMLDRYLPAGGFGALEDKAIYTAGTAMAGRPIFLFTDADGQVAVTIDGCVVAP